VTGSQPEVPPFNKHRWARPMAFASAQLLRNVHEGGTDAAESIWTCHENLPEPSDEKTLRLV